MGFAPLRYLTLDELVYINGTVLNNARILSGAQKIRDMGLLESALLRPQASAFGADAYPTLAEKVAALMHSITRNHPFTDGNKRTATVAGIFMSEANGYAVRWAQEDALKQILALAQGEHSLGQFAAWLPIQPLSPPMPPDAARDIAVINRILSEHRWLLDELAKR